MKWFLLLLIVVSCGKSPVQSLPPLALDAGGSEVGNGGSFIELVLAQGQHHASEIYRQLDEKALKAIAGNPLNPAQLDWYRDNHLAISADLTDSKLIPVTALPKGCPIDSDHTCACAVHPLKIYYVPTVCQTAIQTRRQSTVLMAHEALHHFPFVGSDELTAKIFTTALFAAWDRTGGISEFPHVLAMHNPFELGINPEKFNSTWTGKELLVWDDNSMARYDSKVNRWTKAKRFDLNWAQIVGEGRRELNASDGVWADGRLVVYEADWGNHDRLPPLSDRGTLAEVLVHAMLCSDVSMNSVGAVLNLEANQWKPIPGEGAPSSRVGAHYLTTGKELVIWGGEPIQWTQPSMRDYGLPGLQIQDGAIFDPVKFTWEKIPKAPDLAALWEKSSAVWANNQLLIWGGHLDTRSNYISYTNYGYVYDRHSQKWKAMNLTGAPSPRTGHFAIWAEGVGMIIYGGKNKDSNFVNSGGIYDPKTDTWKEAKLENGPLPDPEDGELKLVWDGLDVITVGDRVSFYHPFSNRWDIADNGLGIMKLGPKNISIWDGMKMIFWNQGLRKGQLFFPS